MPFKKRIPQRTLISRARAINMISPEMINFITLTWGVPGSLTIKFLLFFFPYSVHWKPIISLVQGQ